MAIIKNKHYSLTALAKLGVFPGAGQDVSGYTRFIGTQATRGNYLTRDESAPKINGEHPFKGEDVVKFIKNIK